MSTGHKIGFGIIGCGIIGRFHANAISRVSGAKLIAVADSDAEKAKKLAEEHKIECYADYSEMLKRKDIDAVCVCTPSGMHGKNAEDAANAGKNVLCEKPMEITLERCDRMIKTCKKNKVKLGVIFQRRTYETSMKVKEAVDSGKLGRVILGDAYLKYYRSPEYYRSAGWRATWELDGGGALMNQGIHGIDLLQWIMGPVESIISYTGTLVHKIQVEDTAIAMLRFKSRAMGVIEGTTSVYPGLPTRFEICGEKGSIVLEESTITRFDVLGEEIKLEQPDEGKVGGSSSPTDIAEIGHIKHIEDFVKAIKENRDPLVTGEEARKSVEIILAIYKSGKTNSLVKLPL